MNNDAEECPRKLANANANRISPRMRDTTNHIHSELTQHSESANDRTDKPNAHGNEEPTWQHRQRPIERRIRSRTSRRIFTSPTAGQIRPIRSNRPTRVRERTRTTVANTVSLDGVPERRTAVARQPEPCLDAGGLGWVWIVRSDFDGRTTVACEEGKVGEVAVGEQAFLV